MRIPLSYWGKRLTNRPSQGLHYNVSVKHHKQCCASWSQYPPTQMRPPSAKGNVLHAIVVEKAHEVKCRCHVLVCNCHFPPHHLLYVNNFARRQPMKNLQLRSPGSLVPDSQKFRSRNSVQLRPRQKIFILILSKRLWLKGGNTPNEAGTK